MSKERLEEIREEVEMFRGDMCVTSIEVETSADSILDDMEWLIEQAERVQELENEVLVYKLENRTLGKECEELRKREQELEKLVVAYQTELSIKDNANKRIKKQNKRYREVVTQSISDLENECLWDALAKLKALEGEE